MEQQIILTISILVSGRIETERCLASLNKLRESVPCELILTDTGCPEEMKGLLSKYADRIIPFSWCNDFAAARNVGLEAAKGKWFLYIDDDEWFEDTSEIEQFFLSNEYLEYHSAFYKVRNYGDRQGRKFQDCYVSRMGEITPDSKFMYPIHEILLPGKGPFKYLDDYAHHYGYAYISEEEKLKKSERNIPPLLLLHKQEKHCLRHNVQLILEYSDSGMYDKALSVAYEGIKDFDESFPANGKMINSCYAYVVRSLINQGKYEAACQEAQRFIQSEHINALGTAVICGETAYSCLMLNRIEDGLVYFKQYKILQKAFAQEPQCYQELQTAILDNCYELDHYRWVMMTGIQLAAASGDQENIKTVFQEETTEWWGGAIESWFADVPARENMSIWQHISREKEKGNLILCFLDMRARATILRHKFDPDSRDKSFWQKFQEYIDITVAYYEKIMNSDVRILYPEILPEEYRMAVFMKNAEKYKRNGETVAALRECSRAVSQGTLLTEVIRVYSGRLAEDWKKEYRTQVEENREFWALSEQIKKSISRLLDIGRYEEAKDTLLQLKKMIPEDESLAVLEAKIILNSRSKDN